MIPEINTLQSGGCSSCGGSCNGSGGSGCCNHVPDAGLVVIDLTPVSSVLNALTRSPSPRRSSKRGRAVQEQFSTPSTRQLVLAIRISFSTSIRYMLHDPNRFLIGNNNNKTWLDVVPHYPPNSIPKLPCPFLPVFR
jgi:hypothetical protein